MVYRNENPAKDRIYHTIEPTEGVLYLVQPGRPATRIGTLNEDIEVTPNHIICREMGPTTHEFTVTLREPSAEALHMIFGNGTATDGADDSECCCLGICDTCPETFDIPDCDCGCSDNEDEDEDDHTEHVHWAGHHEDPDTDTSPAHYKFPGGIGINDIAGHLNGNGAQATQYTARATRLDGNDKGETVLDRVKDLNKAKVFLNFEIERQLNEAIDHLETAIEAFKHFGDTESPTYDRIVAQYNECVALLDTPTAN